MEGGWGEERGDADERGGSKAVFGAGWGEEN